MFKSLLGDFTVSEAKIFTFNEENGAEVHTKYSLHSSPGSFGAQNTKPVLQYVDIMLFWCTPQSQTNQPKNH